MKRTLATLLGLLLLAAPTAVQAQFGYMTNANNTNTITITNYTGPGGALTIPTKINGLTVTSIGVDAFASCYSLTSVTLPESVTSIEDYAFVACTGLNSVTMPGSVTSVGVGAFLNCFDLSSVTIPGNVTSIGLDAFADCDALTNITIPGSVTNFGDDAFNYCINLGSVTISSGVTVIGAGAFGDCDSLTNVTIPGSVISIGEGACEGTKLTSITIPGSVTSIGDYAFADDSSLTNAYFTGNAPTADFTVFSNDINVTVYYLPGTSGWSSTFAGRPALLSTPAITIQPQSQTNNADSTVTFSVSATSPYAMGYQWLRNGTNLFNGANISGASTNILTITAISDSDDANYSAVVTNTYGSVTTSNATLVVIDPPSIIAQPTSLLMLAGSNAAFGVRFTGSTPSFQWQFNSGNLLNATNANYTIPSVGTSNAGNYSVVVSNQAGSATSSNAALTVVLSPTSQTKYASSTATFSAPSFGPESLNYQWQKNGTNLTNGGNISGVTNSTLTITEISDSDAANYGAVVTNAFGSVTTSDATLTVTDPPIITAQPTNLVVLAGTNVGFSVSVTGTPPLRYQWLLNSANLLNATNATYTVSSVETNNAGNYSVMVTNQAGSVTSSNAALTVILSPSSETNYASSTATFVVTTISPEFLIYQWQKNGTNLTNGGNISGATNSTLTIGSVSDADAANYRAVVSDVFSSVITSNAALTVNDNLIVVSDPESQTVLAGSNVTFSFTVYGASPFIFQWHYNFNASPFSSTVTQTNVASITLTNVGLSQTGYYQGEVINADGSLWSGYAYLTVLVPPTLSLQLVSGYPLLNLDGMLGYNYVVQYSTNLAATNWSNLLSLTNLSTSPHQFLDPSGVGQPARFYRAFFTQ